MVTDTQPLDYIAMLRAEAANLGVTIAAPVQHHGGMWQASAVWNGGDYLGPLCATEREAIQTVFNETVVLGKIMGKKS